MRTYQDTDVFKMDEALCKLHSLGVVVTLLATLEDREADLTILADMGHLISEIAMETLNMVQDGKRL